MCVVVIIETLLIWVIVGVFINYKRNWYKDLGYATKSDRDFLQWVNVIFAPIALVMALFSVFINGTWKNEQDEGN